MRDVVPVGAAIVAVIRHVGGALSPRFRRVSVSGRSGLPRTRILRVFLVVVLLMAVVTALSHRSGVAVRGIFLPVVVAMVTPVTLVFELAVAPLLSVVVPMLGAASGFGGLELVLRGGFLEVIVAQVVLGIVAPVEGLLFTQVADANQTQQQEQEQGPAHRPTDYGSQVALRQGCKSGGADVYVALVVHQGGRGRASNDRSGNGGRHGGRI